MQDNKKISILILDDEEIVLKRLKPIFEKSGYDVETFLSSKDAYNRLKKQKFNIVITDMKMEDLDGMAILTYVKNHYPTTEVIVITGFATMDTARESFQKGVFEFLAKPFKLSDILDVVKKAEAKIRKING